ncbi:putative cobaltochelatase [Spirosoma endophyticum]|uniref:Mg-protoporphyrin IX chelatase n=1 Tax=Spirosoma endophyticum TaxID=662367 RepID=A0A1I1GCJ2_9BACT|nr:putative cobaltochelatase [Spirosoma endophyticum]SFC07598.1 protoporphyrin IX magnesium-chelatase [Spirosoma endophyticum]
MTYPFSALVAQQKLKQALLLCAVNPGIGGVLIRGEKGTAKSTAARGLADIMPPIPRVAGSRFNCPPEEPLDLCEACQQLDWQVEDVAVPFVNLPLGATEDRVVGSLDLEGVLVERKKKLQPGLLATAHRGILYIDEVNLLPDHLVDVLLDVAAMGVNTIQREGLSMSHPARFTLIGTMNPEEGNLRPQFLDRFGLMVDVDAPRDVAERTEVVRRRIAFDSDPTAFAAKWADQQQALHNQIQKARKLLPSVTLADGLLTLISQLCTELNVTSLRADIVMYKTALTLAALAGRTDVTADDIRQAAELALVHRQRKKPFEESRLPDNKLDELMQQAPPPNQSQTENESNQPSETTQNSVGDSPAESDGEPAESPQQEQVFGVMPLSVVAPISIESNTFRQQVPVGRRSPVMNPQRGTTIRAVPDKSPTNVAISATVQHALLRDADDWGIIRDDLHQNLRIGKTGNLILFVVDASGSMAASRRMEAVKGSVLSLLTNAYQRRDSVGVIAFRGVEAQLLLEPTHSIELAEQAMRNLPTGGRTPLPHALQLASQVVSHLKHQDLQPLLIILSDGKANVALPGGGDAWQQTLGIADQLRERQIPALVLDTDNDYLRLGRAADLAKALGADCLSLDELSAETITQTVSGRIRV